MIILPREVFEEIHAHGRDAYPEECCGALLGSSRDGGSRVTRAERTVNASEETRERRFRIAPRDYLRLERLADALGLALLGFYHSHPDHAAAPSDYDREHAFPSLHYVVLAVASGLPEEITSWVLSEDRGAFQREELRVEGSGE
ncbi:MAG TPA: M67 family metallopeptidase [Thermoanaerobaculia bacterium]